MAPPLWADRHFTVFWAGQTLSELGNSFALVALPLLVLQATGSVAQMGLLTGVAGIGTIVTGVFAGVLVDRLDRRRLMIVCDVVRMALHGAIPVCWLFGPQVWLLYVVMAVTSVFSMIFKVTYVTAVPNLVDGDRIIEANGRLETTNAIAFIVGPMLAGALAGLFGAPAAIAVNAVSFGMSAVALALVRFRVPLRTGAGNALSDVKDGFLAGFTFLWRTPVLRWLAILLTMVSFLTLGMMDVIIFHVREGLGQGDHVVGIVVGVAGGGTVLAAALTPTLRRRLGFGPCWLGSYVLCGAAAMVAGMSTTVLTLAVAVLCYTFGLGLAGISSMSLRQAVTPNHLLGRVTSAFWTAHSALAPLGAAAITGLVAAYGVRGPLLGVGAVFLVVVLVGSGTPVRQRHPERTVLADLPGVPRG
ncbi:MFS transporter [Actinophytocola sediminis]